MGIGAGVGAAIGGIASGVGGVASSLIGGNKAAGGSAQSQYLQALEMNQNIANTQPFVSAGQYGVNALQSGLQSGAFGRPMDLSRMPTSADVPQAPAPFVWNPTQEGLAATPGYQFTLDQGLRATQSAAAAKGLGMSGASLRGAADYATGLADKTYNEQLQNAIGIYGTGLSLYDRQLAGFGQQAGAFQNQFADYWNNQIYPYKQLTDLASLGANAAAGQGTTGQLSAAGIGNAAQAGANAQAAGIQGAGNALTGALNSPGVQGLIQSWGSNAYGNAAPNTPGISASGNPVMTGFIGNQNPTPLPGGGYSWG